MMPFQRHIKNVVHNYTDAVRKVREATSNDPWGPSSTLMSDIADRTYNVISFTEIMQMIWKRLNDKNKNWRHVYKALTLLEYIIKTGSEKVALQCRENIHAIETLMDFYYVDDGNDIGSKVREKARTVNNLLRNEERLKEERKKALLARERLMHGGLGATTGSSSGPSNSYSSFSPQASSRRPDSAGAVAIDRRPSSQPSLSGAPVEFDSALPQSYGEEELQLQLALAISREEHEREQRVRQEEETKEALKLQMVLEQSKREELNKLATEGIANEGPLISTAGTTTGGAAAAFTGINTSAVSGNGGSLFNLIDTSLSVAPASAPDPWTPVLPVTQAAPRAIQSFIPPPPPSVAPNTVSIVKTNFSSPLNLLEDAWTANDPPVHRLPAESNPWATLDPLLASTPASSIPVSQTPLPQNGNNAQSNGTNVNRVFNNPISITNDTSSRKRNPADFLGAHKDLVDLEKLVDRTPASTNPFAVATRSTAASCTNPFNANLPPKPSLNQLTNPTVLALPAPSPMPASAFAFPAPARATAAVAASATGMGLGIHAPTSTVFDSVPPLKATGFTSYGVSFHQFTTAVSQQQAASSASLNPFN